MGDQNWDKRSSHSGRVTRRRLIRWSAAGGAVGLGATLLPAPWRAAFGAGKPYKIGTMQPLSGAAAIIGKTALVGVQMAVDRINKGGGINGRPVELIIADYKNPSPMSAAARPRNSSTRTGSMPMSEGCSPMSASPACQCGKSTRSSTWSGCASTRR